MPVHKKMLFTCMTNQQMHLLKYAHTHILHHVSATPVTTVSVSWQEYISRVQNFALFRMLYSFFWVIPRRPNFLCQCFGTLCQFHLHRRCMEGEELGQNCSGIYTGKDLAQNCLSQSEGGGRGKGRVRLEEQAVEGKDPRWRL